MVTQQPPLSSVLAPLKVTCTTSDCENNLHCFKATTKLKVAGKEGACRSCGVELVDWPRVRRQEVKDVSHTFATMRSEFIRHYFWDLPVDSKATAHALRKGRAGFDSAVQKRIRQSVGKAQPYRDGRQTPFEG